MYNPIKPYKNQILKLIKSSWNTPYISIIEGTYTLFKKKFNYFEVDHTDGLGTKGIYHWNKRSFKNAVCDALAMNLNDLALVRAVPYKLQCHLTLPKEDNKTILKIMNFLVQECKKRNIVITGGETSIQNNMKGFDISLTVSGFVKKIKINQFKIGDVLIGFASGGLHSNGFTMVRKKLGSEFRQEFIEPTKIYLETVLDLNKNYDIHGMMHITGGAYTKLKDLLNNSDAIITNNHKLKPQTIFKELYNNKISDKDMYRTFNCGIGFILSVLPQDSVKIISQLKNTAVIGKVISGTGRVRIQSMFSNKNIEF